ncbi:FecR family protein [Robiginitomaculum antarcticum]|uniref:FecR family protein n=1 Tax=Robiginitomaculum antarcticum TaxID=437507 RepID=UPI000376F077|nr:FecR family protein [Robiginitomaculum antarcticum]
MNNFKIFSPLFIFLLCIASLSLPASAQEQIGINAAVKGNVLISSEERAAEQALVNKPIFLRDQIETAEHSTLQILLKDETTFTVGAKCQMQIDEFVYDPKKDNNRLTARVNRGVFRFVSGRTSKRSPDNITLNTPTASLGIRGTMFEAIVGPEALLCAEKVGAINKSYAIDHNNSTLIVLRGPGGDANTNDRLGRLEVTSAGETVTLTESGSATLITNREAPPSAPFVITEQLFGYFNLNLRTEPRGELNYSPFEIDSRLLFPEIEITYEEGLTPYDPAGELDIPGG